MNGGRRLVTALLAAAIAAVGFGSTALAEEIGGIYAAVDDGVLELSTGSGSVVNTVSLAPAPEAIVFSPDGRQLYAAAAGRHVFRIDVESIAVSARIPLPAAVAAIAFPKGEQLVVAFPSSRTLGLVDTADDGVTQSPALPGAVDLLAGDRRDERVLGAETGNSWVAVYNPTDRRLLKGSVKGAVVALAVDRRTGGGLVATRSPNRLYRLDLTDLRVLWQTDLPAAPTSVAALASGAVISAGAALWSVDAARAQSWGTAGSPIDSLAASDDGKTLYAAGSGRVEALAGGTSLKVVALPKGSTINAVAALPRVSSIAGDGPAGAPGAGGAGSAGWTSPIDPALLTPPDTSAIVDAATRWLGSSPVPAAAAVGGLILALCFLFIRWYERQAAEG